MEIIEKQVEKIKEVPYGYWENHYCNPYGYRNGHGNIVQPFASKGVAGTGLGLN